MQIRGSGRQTKECCAQLGVCALAGTKIDHSIPQLIRDHAEIVFVIIKQFADGLNPGDGILHQISLSHI